MVKRKSKALENFANKIRTKRHALGLTQEELAEKSGFHVNYIGGIERGLRNPSYTTLIALAKALKCSPKDLMAE